MYGYYSYKLNKAFKTIDELNAAEEKLAAKEERENKTKEERAKASKEIEDLIKQRDELQKKINDKVNDFIKTYKSYHWTFRSTYNANDDIFKTFFSFL